jgi:nicotinamidase-related amidase
MQNAFIEKGESLEVRGIRKGVPKLRRFIGNCREKGILVIDHQFILLLSKGKIPSWPFRR